MPLFPVIRLGLIKHCRKIAVSQDIITCDEIFAIGYEKLILFHQMAN